MKNKILLSLLLIGVIFITGCGGKEVSIRCENKEFYEEEYGDKVKYSRIFEAKFRKNGYVSSTKQLTIETAIDDETYDIIKGLEHEGAIVTYDDNKKNVTVLYDWNEIEEPSKNSNGDDLKVKAFVEIWEKNKYSCEITGATREELNIK